MTPEENDTPIRDLIKKVYLPPDLCPTDPAAIEAMLDAVGGQPMSDEQVERILKKSRGELPLGVREEEEPAWSEENLSAEERELVALHRNESGELPASIKEKLRKLREQAKAETEESDGDDELES